MRLKYCTKCVMPNTKPDLFFDKEGVCDACRSSETKSSKMKGINWEARRKEFEKIIAKYRSKDGSNYDCIVPVSGGKDSHYQAYVMKVVYKMNPLLVCFEQTKITELGRKNLENIRQFGDLVYFKKNPEVYKKMVIEAFKRVGDNEWPNHIGIFTIPIQVAVKFKIPLLIWGENSQLEYGGPATSRNKNSLDRRWLEEFGGLLGNRVNDMVGVDGITKEDLLIYQYPSDKELREVGVTGLFLGYFFKWDARKQTELMIKKYGFHYKEDGPIEGTYTNYENLDEATVGLHDYLKFTKYGFGRATDHACLDIRNGRIDRAEGMRLVKKYDGKYPNYGIKNFIEYAGMGKKEIDEVIDSFTNKQIFKCDKGGNLVRDMAGNLIKNNHDNT
ncbi:MAG: N-acetyl sugar amidotransferase [bacterium]|nr:N-acetyl sugar amidotransferase [bacterium]